jgi:hypothetical protein
VLLIATTIALSWLVMMAVHEFGHVLHAWLSGGSVQRVVLHPLAISRTDVAPNPHPQFVAWGGAVWGSLIPLALLVSGGYLLPRYRFLLAFFAGFCCLANGLYLAAGSFTGAGDAGDLLRHGAASWQLILIGLPLSAAGLWLWNGLGPSFGYGPAAKPIDKRLAIKLALALVLWILVTLILSARWTCVSSRSSRGLPVAPREETIGLPQLHSTTTLFRVRSPFERRS